MESLALIKAGEGQDWKLSNFIDSVNISITSYGFIINLFPIRQQMSDQSKSSVVLAVSLALAFCFISYVLLTGLAIGIFGEHNIKQSLFDNLEDDHGALTQAIRIVFLVIFLCNIPYLFYPGKLSVLNVFQEYRLKCFS